MKAVGYFIGLLVGGTTLTVVSNTDMPVWMAIIFAALNGVSGAVLVEMVEWFKEWWDDRESV